MGRVIQHHVTRLAKERRAHGDEAIARGAFGSPSIFVPFEGGERLYFGNDQLPLVAWALDHPDGG